MINPVDRLLIHPPHVVHFQDASERRPGAVREVQGRRVVEDGLRGRPRQPPLRRERLRVPRGGAAHQLRRQEGRRLRAG